VEVISIDAVAKILDLHPTRIEQWISRGQFLPRLAHIQGKKREWDKGEVIRLGAFAKLVENVSLQPGQARLLTSQKAEDHVAEEVGRMTQFVHGFTDDGAFLVCYKTEPDYGWFHEIVRKREVGTFLTSGCFIPKVLMEGRSEEARNYNSTDNTGPASIAVIVDLDQIERQVEDGWPSPVS
jgi:hypothetical protein